jgi:hypothetical protein
MTCRLEEAELGVLDVECFNGYITTILDIGFPAVREVETPRALADGVEDNTQFLGARAVSMTLRLDQRKADMQALMDRINPYMSPRRRPKLVWTMPGSTSERSLVVSGRNAPVTIDRDKYLAVTFQWKSPQAVIKAPEPTCVEVYPTDDVEGGRTYPENYADGGRGPYNQSVGVGERLVRNLGNEVADVTVTIYGPCVGPFVRINGTTVTFTGVTLLENETLLISTERRAILLNSDPAQSRYGYSNYRQWTWDRLRFRPGDNLVRVDADSGDPAMIVCHYHSWIN